VVEDPVSKVLEKGMIVGLANQTVLIRKNKTEIAIEDSGSPIKDKEGKTTGGVLIFRDITERKKVEELLRKQAALIDLSPDAIIVKDLADKITFWSEGAEKIYGYTKVHAVGWNASVRLSTKFSERLEKIVNQLEREGHWSGEVIEQKKDGQEVIVQSWMLMKINENGEGEIFESNVDITERRTLQEKLEESAIRVEEYATQMEELANLRLEQLKSAERLAAIGATAGMVGHDIRNPLQAITGDIYFAKTDLASTPESEEEKNIQESLDEIEKNVSYINKIVADLQDYARLLSPKLEEINLEKTVHSVLANISIPGNVTVKHSIRKDFPKLKLDQSYIQRILTNLSNNAIQTMPKGGKLTINAITKKGKAIISVEDTGEGIPESFRNKLFMSLVTTKSKGQGFGLSVVKRFTEAWAER
jgi:PAS domain S-box-containing protein